ncbi:MAG: hypothetical protein ACLUV2_07020 [Hominenteromicrobium sp.]|uniref:hypothetical protein n=1 Tax=Hominenteromicrobium sp. TaxID=3073581 RepID=UPI00399B0C41
MIFEIGRVRFDPPDGAHGDYTQVPDICSAHCRYYYPLLAVGFDAIYAHWGMTVSALESHYG